MSKPDLDLIRVLRTVEYIGPRRDVAKQIAASIHGDRRGVGACVIRAATVGTGVGDELLPDERKLVDQALLENALAESLHLMSELSTHLSEQAYRIAHDEPFSRVELSHYLKRILEVQDNGSRVLLDRQDWWDSHRKAGAED